MKSLPIVIGFAVRGIFGGGLGLGLPETRKCQKLWAFLPS